MEENVKKEMETLSIMWARWLKSDFDWALRTIIKEGKPVEEGEWDFLRSDWMEKFEHWMYPLIQRLKETKYITDEEVREFVNKVYALMDTTLELIYKLEVNSIE